MNCSIAFVGAGNMARSIIGGLLQQGSPAQSIRASGPTLSKLKNLQDDTGVQIFQDNAQAVEGADIVVLAVKPQKMQAVCQALGKHLSEHTLVVSIAAGIPCDSLKRWLGGNPALVRCMPNTPSLIQLGASGLYAASHVSTEQKSLAQTLMTAVGSVAWVESEDLIDAVTAVSGSGPAYFFLMLESMIEAGIEQGLSPSNARQLAVQTAKGAAELAQRSDLDIADLRRQVTSPGGTTEQAITTFEHGGYKELVKQAMKACSDRAKTLARELGS